MKIMTLEQYCCRNIKAIEICLSRFSNLPNFNRSFFPLDMEEFLQKAPLENLSSKGTYMHSHILSSWENGIPLNTLTSHKYCTTENKMAAVGFLQLNQHNFYNKAPAFAGFSTRCLWTENNCFFAFSLIKGKMKYYFVDFFW